MVKKRTSRELLAESAIELISEKKLDEVTVKEIAENANLSVRTFYNHFRDKYDLMAEIYLDFEREIFSVNEEEDYSFIDSLRMLFANIEKYQAFYRNISDYAGQNNPVELSFYRAKSRLEEFLERHKPKEKLDDKLRIAAEIWIFGMGKIVQNWLKGGTQISADKLLEYVLYGAPDCILQYIDDRK